MARTKKLNPLDWTFLAAETRESMMHVGSLMPFSPPKKLEPDFLRQMMDELKQHVEVHAPWNQKLKYPNVPAHPLQAWVEDDRFDLDYHIRRSALPTPGDERELGILVSRLHSNKMDFHRPLWEVHFIEGLEGGRFAIYFKVHHALVDGYTGAKLLARSLSTDPAELDRPLFFAMKQPERSDTGAEAVPAWDTVLSAVKLQFGASRDIGKAILNVSKAARTQDKHLMSPLRTPKSILNQKIGRNRRFATQQIPLARLKKVAKGYGGTLNDIVLAVCASSLRRFLQEQDALPEKALVAFLPVNIRPKDDPGGGNAVGAMLASLATDVEDPAERFRNIIASTTRAKEQLQGMTRSAIMQYSSLMMAPMMLSQIPGAAGRVRPAFNVCISNVPGPDTPLYFRGWKLEANYPLSIPFHGYGLNITVTSYMDQLNFGFIGCRDTLPHLQKLAVYAGEALDELPPAA